MTETVEIDRASKWYGAVIGVNEVTVSFSAGITGLLGPNGAGKSTLLKLIAGLLRPSLGEVRVMGKSVWGHPMARAEIGFSPEVDGFLEEMTCRAFLRALGLLSGLEPSRARRRAEEILEWVGMAEFAHKRLGACSKGMRQRVKIGQALLHDPQVLILDEPLTGIDPVGREDLLSLFREFGAAGKTVLISTHIIQEVEEVTDRIVLMARGRILAAGEVPRIRALLDEHPLTVRIQAERAREIAAELVAREEVAGVAVGGGGDELTVRVRRPEAFFRALPEVLVRRGGRIGRVESLDSSAEAVFDYLVGGKGEP